MCWQSTCEASGEIHNQHLEDGSVRAERVGKREGGGTVEPCCDEVVKRGQGGTHKKKGELSVTADSMASRLCEAIHSRLCVKLSVLSMLEA